MLRYYLSICLLCPFSARGAEPPAIDRVSPPGVQRGTTAEVKLPGKPGDGPLKVWSNHSQLTFEFTEKYDGAKVTAPPDATPGLHWLRFYNDHGATELRPFFVGVVPEVSETEPNNEVTAAQAIEMPSVLINGVLEKAGEVDTFVVNVAAEKTLVASMQANSQLGSPMDAVLQVLNERGTVVAQNDDDHAMDPQIAFSVPAEGKYFVRTFAFPSAPNSTIRLAGGATYIYRLTVTSEAFVDHVVPAVVDSSKTNTVRINGWNLSDQQRSVEIAPFADSNTSWIAGDFSNAFAVTADGTSGDSESEASPQPLAISGSITGCISESGDEDVYEIQGKKGQKLTISAACRSLYSQLDPVVIVRDSAGKILKEADDRSRSDLDSEAAVTLRADGQYSVTITDRYGEGGERYFYILRCVETTPSFRATVTGNAFVLKDDNPLETPVAIARANGFSEKLTITVTDLPEGVSVEPADSAKDGDTAKKVTLKLTRSADAKGFSGPIRVVCRTESGTEQLAESAIPNSAEMTGEFWLTVVAATEPKADEAGEAPASE